MSNVMVPADRTWADVARAAYRAYATSTGNRTDWADLPRPIRVAWEAASRHVADYIGSEPGHEPDPSRWSGWEPSS